MTDKDLQEMIDLLPEQQIVGSGDYIRTILSELLFRIRQKIRVE